MGQELGLFMTPPTRSTDRYSPGPRSQAATRQTNALKWGLGCAGMSMLLITGAILLAIIVGPALFRSLSPADQERLVRRLPFLAALQPTTAPFSAVLPALDTPEGDPLALLHTPTPSALPPTVAPSATALSAPTLAPTLPFLPSQTPAPPLAPATLTPVPPLPTQPPVTQTPAPTQPPAVVPPATATTAASPAAATAAQAVAAAPTETVPASIAPTETATFAPIPSRHRLGGAMSWEPQRWNNCGPANLVQVMRYLGWQSPQVDVAGAIKPTSNDKNVSPWELARYVNTQTNLRAVNRVAGDLDMVRRLVANNIPVILETGFYDPDEPDEGWIGHYQTVFGYDDASRTLMVLDTLRDETVVGYGEMDELWRHFNRAYVVVYPPEREADAAALVGLDWDPEFNARHAFDLAIAEAQARPTDFFAWFNVGSSNVLVGQYADAALAYDHAFNLAGQALPHRILWYEFGPYEAYYQSGRFDQLLSLITYSLDTSKGDVEELFYWRGMVAAARGDMAAAIQDFDATLAYNQFFTPAALARAEVQDGSFRGPEGVS